MADDFELIALSPDMPEGTDFCLIMDNDLMEPVISMGARVHVSRRIAPEELEVGIFLYKGTIYCRQYCQDYTGKLHLLCANPRCESENLCIGKDEKEKCLCLGKVLLKEKPPMPVYI